MLSRSARSDSYGQSVSDSPSGVAFDSPTSGSFNFNGGLTRRGLLVVGGSVAASLALAACTGTGTSTTGGTSAAGGSKAVALNLWLWAGGPANQTAFNNVAKASSDLKNVTVNDPQVVTGGDYGVAQKLNLALSSHSELPDIVMLNYTEVPQFAALGALADISSAVSSVESDLYDGVKTILGYDGKMVAFPLDIKSKLFFYRADLFEQAGIDATAIKTMDDFIAAGQKFHAKFPNQYMMNLNTQPQLYTFGEMISAYSPISFADTNGKYQITSNPGFGEVLTFLRRIKSSGIAYPADDFSTDWPGAIKNETICGFLGSNWMAHFLPDYAGVAQSGKWKAIPWPQLSPLADQRFGSDAGGKVGVVPKGAPNEQIAIELLRQARFTPEGSKIFLAASGSMPVLKSAESTVIADANQSMSGTDKLATELKFFGTEYLPVEFDSYARVKTFGYDPHAIKVWGSILPKWLHNTVAGSDSINTILSGLQNDIETQVGNPYR